MRATMPFHTTIRRHTHTHSWTHIAIAQKRYDGESRRSTAKGCAITLFALIATVEDCDDELRWTRKINRIYTSLLDYLFCISIFLFYGIALKYAVDVIWSTVEMSTKSSNSLVQINRMKTMLCDVASVPFKRNGVEFSAGCAEKLSGERTTANSRCVDKIRSNDPELGKNVNKKSSPKSSSPIPHIHFGICRC